MLDFVSQRAIVIGEWYIPGHKLRGFLVEELESLFLEEPSNGEVRVENMGMGLEGEELGSIGVDFEGVLEMGFFVDGWKHDFQGKGASILDQHFRCKNWIFVGDNK